MEYIVIWWFGEVQHQTVVKDGDWGWSENVWLEKAARAQFAKDRWSDVEIEVSIADMQQFGDWELVSVTREI